MVLIQGENGEGKSNLLEALYTLAIAKSHRASNERELVRRQAAAAEGHAQVSAVVERDGGSVRVQIDLRSGAEATEADAEAASGVSFQKYVRVNGVPRRSSELVGEVNAVMFSAQDLELVLGPPPVRRRYLDILISQLDQQYLRALQRYQRVISQRNHLLKTLREGRAQSGELDFWDDELVDAGKQIVARRADTIRTLSQLAEPIHRELTGGGEGLALVYRPSVDINSGTSEDELEQSFRSALELGRTREVAQGFTVAGPHRDDLQMLLEGMDAGLYASRGQCRTVVLAMKLAEVQYLMDRRGQEPILLLDDVLSELDAPRRAHVLDRAQQYQQCFITTADVGTVGDEFLSEMSRYVVSGGRVERVEDNG